MFFAFLFLAFVGFSFSHWLLGIKSRPGPGQVVSGAQFAVVHLWIRVYTLGRDGLPKSTAGRIIQQVRLGVRAHGWGAGGAVVGHPSEHGQVDMLTAHVGDRVATTIGHDNVVPGTERGGREVLWATGVLFGAPGGNDHGAVGCNCLHGTLEGLEDALALLFLLLLT